MNEQQLAERLADTLRIEASTVTSPPDAWDRFAAGSVTPVPAVHHPRRVWLLAPVAVVGIAALIVGVVVLRPSGSHPSTSRLVTNPPPTILPGPAPGPTAPPLPASVGPVGGPVPKGFVATSVTFVTAADGWVLGTAPCSAPPCTSVARTTDGGRSWVGIPAPRTANVTTLRFADRRDGWAYGTSELWSTHDGGATWHRVTLPAIPADGTIEDVEAAAGLVRAAATDDNGHVRIATSPVSHDAWQVDPALIELGGGPVPTGQLVLHGSSGWFIQIDRTVVGGVRLVNGHWVAWAPPCLNAGGPALLSASTATDVAAVCDTGIWTGNAQGERLFVSSDGGTSFHEATGPAAPADVRLAATPAAGTVVVVDGSGRLSATFDGGITWAPVAAAPLDGTPSDLGFTTATQGVVVGRSALHMTRDGGRTWTSVPIR